MWLIKLNIKKLIIMSLLAVMLLGCIGSVSAEWFDFGNDNQENNTTGSNGKIATNLSASLGAMDTHDNTYAITITLTPSDNTTSTELDNQTLNVNITGPNGVTKNYNNATDGGFFIVWVSEKGNYNVSATYDGNDKYEGCTLNTMVEVKDL